MTNEKLKSMSVKDRFLWWVRERHQTYLRRRSGLPPPWSANPIMAGTFFTNVYRELDKTTVWFRECVRQPLMEDPTVLFATIAFRWFNLPATGEVLLGGKYLDGWDQSWSRQNLLVEWDLTTALDRLRAWRNDREHNPEGKLFTGAFNISNGGSTKEKMVRVCEDYVQPAWEACGPGGWLLAEVQGRSVLGGLTLAWLHERLKVLPGLGGSGFMAAQVVADVKYTALAGHAKDWWTWCSPGPGSLDGLRRLCSFSPREFLARVNELREELERKLPKYPRFHSQDVQNCLCEFDKFERVLAGERPKRVYRRVQ